MQSLLQPQFDESDVEFHTHVDPPTLEITADGEQVEQVEQVLLNLLRNVRQAATGKPGARVELNSYLSRGKVILEIADNGPGIVEEALDKVFIPFFTT